MRRSHTQSIGEVLREYVEAMKMRRRLKESRISKYWTELVGEYAASLTRRIFIKDRVLFVYLDSSILRNDLMMMREKLLNGLNEKAGEEIVTKIVLK